MVGIPVVDYFVILAKHVKRGGPRVARIPYMGVEKSGCLLLDVSSFTTWKARTGAQHRMQSRWLEFNGLVQIVTPKIHARV